MKHSSALASLSREHRLAVHVSKALELDSSPQVRRRLPADGDGRRLALDGLAQTHFLPHFIAEEQAFEAHARGHSEQIDLLLEKMKADHRALRSELKKLQDSASPSAEDFDAFARRLERHVQFEESELFPMLETLPESARAKLDRALKRVAEHERHEIERVEPPPELK